MKSIRTRLLVSLLSVVLLSAAASAALTYTNVLSEAEALFDYQLRQMALRNVRGERCGLSRHAALSANLPHTRSQRLQKGRGRRMGRWRGVEIGVWRGRHGDLATAQKHYRTWPPLSRSRRM